MDPFSPISQGDGLASLSATAWNDFLRMLTWWRRQQASMTGPSTSLPPDVGTVNIQNAGPDVDRFGVLGLDNASALDPTAFLQGFQEWPPILIGNSPSTSTHRLKFAIALEPIQHDTIGRAAVAGVVPVQVYLDANFHGLLRADIKGSDGTKLALTPGGFPIVFLQGGNDGDAVWAFVELGQPEGPLYAQQHSDQDGTHPLNQTRKYDITVGGSTVTVPVLNKIFSLIDLDLRTKTSLIQGIDGQYQLAAIDNQNAMRRGTLELDLADGGSATVIDQDGASRTVFEVLGLNGGKIPAGKRLWHVFNPVTGREEAVSAGC